MKPIFEADKEEIYYEDEYNEEDLDILDDDEEWCPICGCNKSLSARECPSCGC